MDFTKSFFEQFLIQYGLVLYEIDQDGQEIKTLKENNERDEV